MTDLFRDAFQKTHGAETAQPEATAPTYADVMAQNKPGSAALPAETNRQGRLRINLAPAAEQAVPVAPPTPVQEKPVQAKPAEVKPREVIPTATPVKPVQAAKPAQVAAPEPEKFVAQPTDLPAGTQLANHLGRLGPMATGAYALTHHHGELKSAGELFTKDAANLLTEERKLELISSRDALHADVEAAHLDAHNNLHRLWQENPSILERVKIGQGEGQVAVFKVKPKAEPTLEIQQALNRRDALIDASVRMEGTAAKGVGIGRSSQALRAAANITDNTYLVESVNPETLSAFTNSARAAHIEAEANSAKIMNSFGPKVAKAAATFGGAQVTNYITDRLLFPNQNAGAFSLGADLGTPFILMTNRSLPVKFGVMAVGHLAGRYLDYKTAKDREESCKSSDSAECK